MKTGQFLVVLSGVVPVLQKEGIMDANGELTPKAKDAQAWDKVALDLEAVIKQYVTVPAKVDALIRILPELLTFLQ